MNRSSSFHVSLAGHVYGSSVIVTCFLLVSILCQHLTSSTGKKKSLYLLYFVLYLFLVLSLDMTKQSLVSCSLLPPVRYLHTLIRFPWAFSSPAWATSALSASPPMSGLSVPYSPLWPIIILASILSWNWGARIGSSTSYISLISDYLNTLFEQLGTVPKIYIITGHWFLNISKDSLADNVASWWAKHKTRNPLDGCFKAII